ncbi:hypothetical protein IEQ34_012854 [Dendrobium chrysotoxum]|uniref:Uncharacterized protein n=1 Tax=Dendrobium chrysotoxum TaxID=161865 RepID=A0AAV7GPD3_DENCH|nr:hypothetical protein IEQ34_012854 [Dendrobium chrysotoxum]
MEKWGKMRELHIPLHIGAEDIMKLHNVPDVEYLLYENQKIDRLQINLVDEQGTINQLLMDQQISGEKIAAFEDENKRFQNLIAEKEATLSKDEYGSASLRVIEDFKESIAFKTIIQDRIKEVHDHIYDVKVKALEQQCIDEGFIRGFFKGVHLVQRLTPSQASYDSPSDPGDDDIESKLREVFSNNDKIIEIV